MNTEHTYTLANDTVRITYKGNYRLVRFQKSGQVIKVKLDVELNLFALNLMANYFNRWL